MDKKTELFLANKIARKNQELKDKKNQELKKRRFLKPIDEVFCNEQNYYYDSWLNGNKNHVLSHLALCCGDRFKGGNVFYYNSIISQFSHDKELLNHILNKSQEKMIKGIDNSYL